MAPGMAELLRWEQAGGIWRVVTVRPDWVELALLSCDGAEEMARLGSADPQLITYVSGAAG